MNLKDYIDKPNLELNKNGMRVIIPKAYLVRGNTTKRYTHYFFFGFLPPRELKDGVVLPKEFCVGLFDENTESGEIDPESIRIIRLKTAAEIKQFVDGIGEGFAWLKRKANGEYSVS